MTHQQSLTDEDYVRLLGFRTAMRKFLDFSRQQAESLGLTPAQHQLLLAIRGLQVGGTPTISDIAKELLIKHHSAVELVDRAEEGGLVKRRQDQEDHRVVRLELTSSGATKLESISASNLARIRSLGPGFQEVWDAIERLGS